MLEIEGLSVELDSVPVLREVSATIERASWVGLVGPNGAGKTTLLRAIAGLVGYRGAIHLDGTALARRRPRAIARMVAYVPQHPLLPPAMTVTDYVLLGRSAHHRSLSSPTRQDRRVAAEVLARLGLAPLAERRLGQLSGGEAQRAVMARSLAQQTPLVVLDEPTSSLDLGHAQLVLELAEELRREHGLTVLAALHDLTLAAQYADRLIVLSQGRALLEGRPAEVLGDATIGSVFNASVEVLSGRSGLVVAPVRPCRGGEARRASAPGRGLEALR